MGQSSDPWLQASGIEETADPSIPIASGQVSIPPGKHHVHTLSPPTFPPDPSFAIAHNEGSNGPRSSGHDYRPNSSGFCMPASSAFQTMERLHHEQCAGPMMRHVPMDPRFADPRFADPNMQSINAPGQNIPSVLSSSVRPRNPTVVPVESCTPGFQQNHAPVLVKKNYLAQQPHFRGDECKNPQAEANNVPMGKVCHELNSPAFGDPILNTHQVTRGLKENVVVVKEARSGKGKLEQLLSDGRRLVKFTNGSVKEILPDGTINIVFANGDAKRASPNGVVEYYYCSVDTWQTTHPNSAEVFYFTSGQKEAHHPGGEKEILFPDGVVRLVEKDG